MNILMNIAGTLILVVGILLGLADGNLIVIALSVIGGFMLLGMSKIIELMEQINERMLHVPYTRDHLRSILQASPDYVIEGGDFEIYPEPQSTYTLLNLDGETYIRARAFRKYMSQRDEEYTFSFPDRQPVVLNRASRYHPGAELFAYEDQVYVMLGAIGLRYRISGHRLILEKPTEADTMGEEKL
ncbi:hypothetical protein GE107_09135 [Cohnella sp. CFH 77786]|uniref:hypothetical protein n=1 Tax=Cohnella sp. CFH 77786 TaxID=2662265 RepID=UPI001C60F973|nr:hypothetical protein [Cohnella sp. CFH 77786]MBW5446221.1 hypothetical protein [Cohnella sp. CFH 77786]